MKLPGANETKVQGLGRRDASLPTEIAARQRRQRDKGSEEGKRAAEFRRAAKKEDLRGASADFDTLRQDVGIANQYFRADQDKYRAMASIAGDVINTGARFNLSNQAAKAQRETQQANMSMQEVDKAFTKRFGGKTHLTPDDIKGTVVDTPANRARTQIPAAEVMPQLMEEMMGEAIKSVAPGITNDHFRGEWQHKAEMLASKRVEATTINANQEYESQVRQQQLNEYEDFMEAGETGSALAMIDNMLMSEPDREALREETRTQAEINIYKNMVTEGNENSIDQAIQHLSQPFDKYTQNGHLDQDQRLAARNMLRAEKSRIDSAKQVDGKADYSIVKYQASLMKKQLADGVVPDMEELQTIREAYTDLMGVKGSGVDAADIMELNIMEEVSARVGFLNVKSPEVRDGLIAQYMDENTSVFDKEVGTYLMKANEALKSAARSDMMGTALKSGHKIAPLDTQNFGAFLDGLPQRIKDHAVMREIYGEDQGLFSKQEAQQMGQALSSMPIADRVQAFGLLSSSVDSHKTMQMYEQIATDGGAPNDAMAGEVVSRFDGQGSSIRDATMILDGARIRKDNPAVMKSLNTGNQMYMSVQAELDTLFGRDLSRQGAATEAVINHYIAAAEKGDVDIVNPDTSQIEKSIESVFGQRVNQGGHNILSFEPDMDQREFDNYLRSIPEEYYKSLGSVWDNAEGSMDYMTFRENLADGTFQLEQIDSDSYLVNYNGKPLAQGGLRTERVGGELVPASNNTFIFKYDPGLILDTENIRMSAFETQKGSDYKPYNPVPGKRYTDQAKERLRLKREQEEKDKGKGGAW